MSVSKPRYSKEEFARRGDEIYDRDISPHVEPDDEGKFVVIDIETGAYEIDQDELAASDRLLARRLDAQMWTRRVGSRYARRFGPRERAGGACIDLGSGTDGRLARSDTSVIQAGTVVQLNVEPYHHFIVLTSPNAADEVFFVT